MVLKAARESKLRTLFETLSSVFNLCIPKVV